MNDRIRNSKRAYLKRRRQQDLIIKIIAFVVVIACIVGGVFCINLFSSSREKADLDKYYGIKKEKELAIIIDNEIVGAKGTMINGKPYVEYSVVRDYLNSRFYVDMNENLLLYTLPNGTIQAEVGSKEYTLQKESKQKDYVI